MHKFKVTDMTCGHCEAVVTKTLKGVDPDARVKVDLGKQEVEVESARDADDFSQALAAAGYPPRSV